MNEQYRKPLPGSKLDYFDTRAAIDSIAVGAYDRLPYTSRVLAENLVRRCEPADLDAALRQIVERRSDLDFPWYPARVVCHDILGQTALVDLAGLRDAIAHTGIEACVTGVPSVFEIWFTKDEPYNHRSAKGSDFYKNIRFSDLLLRQGVLKAAEKFFISAVHTDEDIERTLEAFGVALEQLAEEVS